MYKYKKMKNDQDEKLYKGKHALNLYLNTLHKGDDDDNKLTINDDDNDDDFFFFFPN